MRKFLPILLILLVSITAFAQNKGRIVGTITTPEGAVVSGVSVTISSDSLISRTVNTMTNERGMFRFSLLPVGTFTIKLEKEGYKSIEQSGVVLGFDDTVTLNKVMSTSDFEDVITITGEAPVVDKTSTSIKDKLDLEFLQNQANTQNVWTMPNLSAGYNDDSGLGGVQDAGNSYNIDGINVSDPATKTLAVGANLESVEQLDVSLFGSNAEYGSFTGASLNVVTKSGGNELSGEGNYFGQRADWVSDNTTEFERIAAPTAADVDRFSGALGGPIMQDKVWFFGNYAATDSVTQYNTLDGVIDASEDPQRFFGKVSARWDDRNISQFSYTHYERLRSHRPFYPSGTAWEANVESSLWSQGSDSDTFLAQHSYVLNDNIILEGRYAGFRSAFDLTPRLGFDAPLTYDIVNGVHLPGSNANRADIIDRDRDNFLGTANYYLDDMGGNHNFKVGVEYESSLGQRFLSLTDAEFWSGTTPLQKFDYGSYTSATRIQRWAGFLQDSWSVNDRLTLNLGVRLDSTVERADDPDVAPIGDENIFSFNDPAYRAGFAYDLMGDGKTVIRGFVGRFYEGVVTQDVESFVTIVPPEIISLWDGNEWFVVAVSGGSGNVLIDPDYSNQYSEGVTFGIEREIMENLAGAVTFIYKRDRDIVGQISPDFTADLVENYSFSSANGSYNGPYYANYNLGSQVLVTNPKEGDPGVLGDLFRNYYGVVLELNKRMSDNWSVKANYTYSRNTGTAGQAFGAIQGFSNYSDPNSWINNDGRAQLERPHVAKISGTYIAPFDIFISPAFTWQSGWAYAYTHQGPDADALINVKPVDGEDRYDSQMNLDLRMEKAFIISERYRIGVIADIFNVFNDDAVTNYFSTRIESTNFQVARSIVPARFYQVGVRLLF